MSYLKGLGKFLWKVLAGLGVILGIFQLTKKWKVSTWVIPDWIPLTLIALLFAIILYTAYWVNRYGHGEDVLAKPKKPKLRPTEENMFILSLLAHRDNQCAIKMYLSGRYMETFGGKTRADFNVVFSELRERNYVSTCGYELKDSCLIPFDGINYFQKHRKKFEQRLKELLSVPSKISDIEQEADRY